MKKFFFIPFAVIMAFALAFTACNDDDDDDPGDTPNPPVTGSNVVIIDYNITNVTTWSGDSIYIIKKYDFYVQNTLTIEPGCIIKFHPADGPYMMLGGSGTIIAQGTAADPIVFTSYKDDAHGGDNNGDGTATSPAPKDWGEINTNGCNGSIFEYCEFYYGGDVLYNATLTLYGDNYTVNNCTFAHNDGSYTSSAGDVGVLNASDAEANTTITNNVFYDNVRPLSISDAFSLDASNIFHNPANTSETNTYNGIFVETINHVSSNITWEETEVAFVIDDNDWWILSGYHLTLANDVVLKFKAGSFIVLDDGTSSIVNYNGSGVYFTSYKDDTYKGDTNADGSATSPAANDWGGIYDNTLTIPSPYYYGWANILYDSY